MNGILIVNKQKQYTSHDVVAKVKKLLKTKVGHTGTLDPMATGVLPLLLGEGTKLSKYLIEHDKVYEAVIQLGTQTDTADAEGQVIKEQEVNANLLNKENIEEVFKSMQGKQIQTPPIYSAIKVKGKKLYEYARANKDVEIPKREIEIYKMQLISYNAESATIAFRVHCSKGTYIRTLCETIAEKLETVGYMMELNRVRVGNFDINEAVSLDEIEKNIDNKEFWEKHFISIEQFFMDKPKVILNEVKMPLFLNGVQLTIQEPEGVCRVYDHAGKFVGTGTIAGNLLKRDIVV